MARELTRSEGRLLGALREAEASAEEFTASELAERSGYARATVQTYLTKKLLGFLVEEGPGGTWRARGALDCTDDQFAHRMSQKGGAKGYLSSVAEWRTAVEQLLAEGKERGFTLSARQAVLATSLAPSPRDPEDSPAVGKELGMTYTINAASALNAGWDRLETALVGVLRSFHASTSEDILLGVGLMNGLDTFNEQAELLLLWFTCSADWDEPLSMALDEPLRASLKRLECHQLQGPDSVRFGVALATGGAVYRIWMDEGSAAPVRMSMALAKDGSVATYGSTRADLGPEGPDELPKVILA